MLLDEHKVAPSCNGEKMAALTKEQEQKMLEYRDEWLKIGLCTDETDWEKAQHWINKVYEIDGTKHPSYVYSRSPIEATLYRHLLWFVWEGEHKGLPSLAKLAEACREYHKTGPRDIGDYSVIGDGEQFNAYDTEHHNQMRKDLCDVLLECCTSNKRAIRKAIKERMFHRALQQESCSDLVNSCFWGQHEWWIPYYRFPEEHLGVEYDPQDSHRLNCWAEIAKSCGWWATYSEICILVDRPLQQHINEEFLGHNEEGPTVLYGDGFRFYLIESIRVDEQIVMRPETQTIEQINKETNQDIRSIRIERFGWPRYLKESGAEKLDERHNDVENQLEALMQTRGKDRRLLVTCPTGRMFALGVPPSVNTCEEAQKWLAGPAANVNVIART